MNEPLKKEQYEATVQRLEAQLASERQAHNIMDAAYWAAKGREADLTAALGALRLLLLNLDAHFKEKGEAVAPGFWRYEIMLALAPDAVQQAIEAGKAKDAEIEQAHTIQGALLADIQQSNRLQHDAEAKLAETIAALLDFYFAKIRPKELKRTIQRVLADPSRAAIEYHEALAVQERVKVRLATLRDWRDGQPYGVSGLIENEMKLLEDLLLGDAVQEESPLDPSAGEDAVIERLRLDLKQTDEANVMLKLERTTLEARLAVATGLLRDGYPCIGCRLGKPLEPDEKGYLFHAFPENIGKDNYVQRIYHIGNEALDAFLANPSQAAAQEESSLDPSAGEDAVIERLREMEEKP